MLTEGQRWVQIVRNGTNCSFPRSVHGTCYVCNLGCTDCKRITSFIIDAYLFTLDDAPLPPKINKTIKAIAEEERIREIIRPKIRILIRALGRTNRRIDELEEGL